MGTLQESSAVAERPRDASCLSVFSFNSTISRAQSFISVLFSSDSSRNVELSVINKIH